MRIKRKYKPYRHVNKIRFTIDNLTIKNGGELIKLALFKEKN